MVQLAYQEWCEYNKESLLNLHYELDKSNSYLLFNITYNDFIFFCYKNSSHYKYIHN